MSNVNHLHLDSSSGIPSIWSQSMPYFLAYGNELSMQVQNLGAAFTVSFLFASEYRM